MDIDPQAADAVIVVGAIMAVALLPGGHPVEEVHRAIALAVAGDMLDR